MLRAVAVGHLHRAEGAVTTSVRLRLALPRGASHDAPMGKLRFHGGLILDPVTGPVPVLEVDGERIGDGVAGERAVDLDGFILLPGIVDLHGDGFERHLAPRRGALRSMEDGLVALDAELAAAGITTAVLAQFWSWEGGLRAPEFARGLADALAGLRPTLRTDMHIQLRVETSLVDDFAAISEFVRAAGIRYVVFNDHLPHDRLAQGRRPPRLTGQALKSGRNPEAHLALMQSLHARRDEAAEALPTFAERLRATGVVLGTHDDGGAADREAGRALGATIAEFPETAEAARAAHAGAEPIILGAPNVVRGASHAGNASARDLIAEGLCDALVSDYHYPSLRTAAVDLAGGLGPALARPWGLLSSGPAQILGWTDRGRLRPGARADLTVLDARTGHVTASFCAGRVSFAAGAFADRLVAG